MTYFLKSRLTAAVLAGCATTPSVPPVTLNATFETSVIVPPRHLMRGGYGAHARETFKDAADCASPSLAVLA